MRQGLLSELANIGYEIFLEGENVKLRYLKSDVPPEAARQLIDELRKFKAEIVNVLKTHTIAPAEIVESAPPESVIWRNHYQQGTPKARKESLQQVMTAIWETAYEETMKKYPQGYELTRTGLEAEDNVTAVYHRVLSGKALLADFRQAVLDMLDQGLNYEDITAAIGISKGRISQIKSEAISKGILNQKGHYKN